MNMSKVVSISATKQYDKCLCQYINSNMSIQTEHNSCSSAYIMQTKIVVYYSNREVKW